MQKTLSKQGVRDTKLTVLIPSAVMEDLRALRMATFQSTGDLVNRLIEAEIEANSEAVREGRELLDREHERQARAKARREAVASDPAGTEAPTEAPEDVEPSEAVREAVPEYVDPRTLITLEDVAIWSQEGSEKEAPRRIADGEEFVKWLRVEGRTGTLKDADDFGVLYASLHAGQSKGTIEKHVGRVRSLARWWAKR